MPRLDASRLAAWRELQSVVADIQRHVDDDLRREWAVPLGSFEVLAALRGERPIPPRAVALTFDDGSVFDVRDVDYPGLGPQRGESRRPRLLLPTGSCWPRSRWRLR